MVYNSNTTNKNIVAAQLCRYIVGIITSKIHKETISLIKHMIFKAIDNFLVFVPPIQMKKLPSTFLK